MEVLSIVGIGLGLIAFAGSAYAIWFFIKGQSSVSEAVQRARQESFRATVVDSAIQELRVGRGGKRKHLTVTYRREDGAEGNVQAYENDAMRFSTWGRLRTTGRRRAGVSWSPGRRAIVW